MSPNQQFTSFVGGLLLLIVVPVLAGEEQTLVRLSYETTQRESTGGNLTIQGHLVVKNVSDEDLFNVTATLERGPPSSRGAYVNPEFVRFGRLESGESGGKKKVTISLDPRVTEPRFVWRIDYVDAQGNPGSKKIAL